jgi:hypothetical protein
MVDGLMRRRLPQLVCGLFGLALFALYFSSHEAARRVNLMIINDYFQIIFAFTLLVGVVGFARINLESIRRGEGRLFRVVALIGLLAMPLLALGWGIKGGSPFMWVFENIQVPMQSTVFALLAFFVASASYRGFRARSIPAAVLLVSALLMLISRSALGDALWDEIGSMAEWVRSYPSMSARRAILIGIGLGSLTTSLRVIIGIERTWLGGEK